jgi:hypothetical protein
MSSDTVPFVHPVSRCVHAVTAALDDLGDAHPGYLSMDGKREALVQLAVLSSRIEGLRLQVIAASDDVAELDGCRNVSSWLVPRTRTDFGPNGASERLSGDLENSWRRVGAGLRDGRVNLAQVKVIVRALNNLGDDVPQLVLAKAETHLIEQAQIFGPKQLRVLGDKILEVVAPDLYEDEERKKLEKSEQRASAQTRLSMTNRGDGTVDLKARIPEADAARLKRYLEAFTSPRHDAKTPGGAGNIDLATGQRLPYDRCLGNAFRAFLESIDPMRTPIQGGDATRVIVTIPWKDLKAGVGVGMLGDGTRVSVGEVRRLAGQRRDHARGSRWQVRGARPGQDAPALHRATEAGDGDRASGVPGRRVHDPGCLVAVAIWCSRSGPSGWGRPESPGPSRRGQPVAGPALWSRVRLMTAAARFSSAVAAWIPLRANRRSWVCSLRCAITGSTVAERRL